ncbi:MAG: amidohydrolase [Gemmatimonadaceae bacterium]|nr:amidohydrolase [Acetobacteraceae bacterium]
MVQPPRVSPELQQSLVHWRRHLHQHPELSLHEHETAAFVARTLTGLGVPFVAGVGGHGLVATLTRGRSNRSVGLRADMDALPILETTGLPYASSVPGVMHACGHDGHTASLLGAAALLMADTAWSGTVHLVFQPAEEGYGGARLMLADGLLDRFPMERIFGYHNWPGLEAGTVAVHAGPVMAAGSRIDITIDGHAGHAALPHLARDPLLASAHLLVALQSLVARNVDPLDAAVVSICMLNAGSAVNQIPGQAVLRGTFRSHKLAVRELVEAGIRRIAAGIGATFGVSVAVEIVHGVTVTVNTTGEADLASASAADIGATVRRDLPPSMAGEDFGHYLMQRPGAFVWIGNGPAVPGTELHNPGYDFNDAILPVAAEWLAATARRALVS